jgi:hypothetical protein
MTTPYLVIPTQAGMTMGRMQQKEHMDRRIGPMSTEA